MTAISTISEEDILMFDELSSFIDDKLGRIEIGDLLWIKSKSVLNRVVGFSDFINTIETDSGIEHCGIMGYCYNRNIVRVFLKNDPRYKEILQCKRQASRLAPV